MFGTGDMETKLSPQPNDKAKHRNTCRKNVNFPLQGREEGRRTMENTLVCLTVCILNQDGKAALVVCFCEAKQPVTSETVCISMKYNHSCDI